MAVKSGFFGSILRNGAPVQGTVTVTNYVGGAAATLYASNHSTTLANPLTSDADGNFAFYIDQGSYRIEVSNGSNTRVIERWDTPAPVVDDKLAFTDIEIEQHSSSALNLISGSPTLFKLRVEDSSNGLFGSIGYQRGGGGECIWYLEDESLNTVISWQYQSFSWPDATNLAVGTTTGTKIGTATTQKLGFWNVTPVVQPAAANQAALTNSTGGSQDGTLAAVSGSGDDTNINNNFTDIHTLLDEIRTALVNTGIIKGSA